MTRIFVWLLCFSFLLSLFSADAFAIKHTPPLAPNEAKLSVLLSRLGSGESALVAVRLRDKSVFSGSLTGQGPESFTLVDTKSGIEHQVSYSQVARMQGYNFVTGVEVHQGTGIRGKIAGALRHVLLRQHVPANSLTNGEKSLIIGLIIGVILAIVLAKVL